MPKRYSTLATVSRRINYLNSYRFPRGILDSLSPFVPLPYLTISTPVLCRFRVPFPLGASPIKRRARLAFGGISYPAPSISTIVPPAFGTVHQAPLLMPTTTSRRPVSHISSTLGQPATRPSHWRSMLPPIESQIISWFVRRSAEYI